ncbi:hypothetical protein [Methylocystis sp.]|uniref:hypothetical protein n=1 Tax=Methylocystis sp. TaxID=1911079 RepID=UPI0025D79F9F|nr:hypothetical protein [Methylocystis sp.]
MVKRDLKRLSSLGHIQPWRLLGESRSAFYRRSPVERAAIHDDIVFLLFGAEMQAAVALKDSITPDR